MDVIWDSCLLKCSLVFMMKIEFIKEDANVNICIMMLKIM